MEIRQLKIFMVVCEEMSFTKAAKKLSYAQSTVSDNIIELEKRLGCLLFERMGKKIYLTKKGEILKELGGELLVKYEEVVRIVEEKDTSIIRIGIIESLCSYKFPNFFRRFLTENSDIEITFEITSDTQIIEMLRSNTIDMGFILLEHSDFKDINSYRLFEEEIVFIGSKNVSGLEDEGIVIPKGRSSYVKDFYDYYEKNNISRGAIIKMESIEGIKSYVRNGFGISFLPRTTVTKEIEDGTIKVLPAEREYFHEVKIMVHKDKTISDGMKRLIEKAMEEYGEE